MEGFYFQLYFVYYTYMNLIIGMLYGLIAQILTFLQLQGNIKYHWFEKHPIILLSTAVPISYLFIKSVEHMVTYYDGQIWPSRLIGFAIGIIVFALMSYYIFKEPITLKTFICLILGGCILGIQIIWK
jgi:multidrug transporter EmrE-like cation transporter